MKNYIVYLLSSFIFFISCQSKQGGQNLQLAKTILADSTLIKVDSMAKQIIKEGFNAGSGYSQVWVRDFNTFIETALDVYTPEQVKEAILLFFALQQKNDEIIDGYVLKKDFNWGDPHKYYSTAAPDYIGFKNDVETDQETSLIQLTGKYIKKTGDTSILNYKIEGISILTRMEKMIEYLLRERYNKKYGLIWGAMTADWGDVQYMSSGWGDLNPHDPMAADWNPKLSFQSIDVYDNAMLIIALDYLNNMTTDTQKIKRWKKLKTQIYNNTRKYLWDPVNKKFIPHIYPDKSPIPDSFDERKVHYHGGTTIAIEAGLLSKAEIAIVNKQMLENVKLSGMPSIGLTMYPAYPQNFFRGSMANAYNYQNGGDWTWFGGRMIEQLIAYGYIQEAYDEVRPMIDLVIKNNGFYEWFGPGGVPSGSGKFKGSAGVLNKTINEFKKWALAIQNGKTPTYK